MSTQILEANTESANKHKNITCLIHYNENDDQTKIFEVLKKFRIERGLKFSHHKEYIFFTLSSEFLDEFYKERPFKISRFQTKSSYKCDKETSDKLMNQKDSFIRMIYNDENGILSFMSRTTPRIHGLLVRRIFSDSNQEFNKLNYNIFKDENNINTHENNDGFIKVQNKYKTELIRGQNRNHKQSSNVVRNNNSNEKKVYEKKY